jgi:hypothetical protein
MAFAVQESPTGERLATKGIADSATTGAIGSVIKRKCASNQRSAAVRLRRRASIAYR